MRVLTTKEMREADAYTIERLGVPALTLMERAGEALKEAAQRLAPKGKILIVCGGGNNGGDGFVCARKLMADFRRVDVVYLGKTGSEECQISRAEYEMCGGEVFFAFPLGKTYSLVVDCVFGTGYKSRGNEEEIFQAINGYKERGAKILSADIPSGIGEDGRAQSGSVIADETLCLGYLKTAAVMQDGLDACGRVTLADIGISLPEGEYATLAEREDVAKLLPKRKRNTHKGSYGKAAIVGGSLRYSGAAHLAIEACVRGGAGYASLYLPKSLFAAFIGKTPEALLCPCQETFEEEDYLSLLEKDAVGFGVGADVEGKTTEILRFLLTRYEGKLLLDADALNALAKISKEEREILLTKKKCALLLTPHVKEFARLTGVDVEEVLRDGLTLAKEYAKKYRLTVLLKGATTIVTDGARTTLCAKGNAGLAKGGSGDALTGLVTALCAGGLSVFDGGVAGAYLTGLSAEIACEKIGEPALTARDVISYLGRAFFSVQR